MYITQGSTLPVPFNMLPSPKSARCAWNAVKHLVSSDGNRLVENKPSYKSSVINVRAVKNCHLCTDCILLCSRQIGRITRLARPCLSLCSSVPYGLVTRKQRNVEKKQNWHRRSPGHEWVESRFSVEKVRTWKPHKTGVAFTYGRPINRRRIRRRLPTSPLLGLIYCRRLDWTDSRCMSYQHSFLFTCM